MTDISLYNQYGADLEKILRLKTSPIAVKMIENDDDIPDDAIRPKKDLGYHIAQCQAFAKTRREKETIAMLREDNWCPGPVLAYGLVERPETDTCQEDPYPYKSFEFGRYIGILSAPLISAGFEPDLVIIYSDTRQLRHMMLSLPLKDRTVNSYYFPWSCAYSVVNPIETGEYWIVLPDPGEYERALCGDDEMILSIPAEKFRDFMVNFKKAQTGHWAYENINMEMRPDFPLPEVYRKMFKKWGMDY